MPIGNVDSEQLGETLDDGKPETRSVHVRIDGGTDVVKDQKWLLTLRDRPDAASGIPILISVLSCLRSPEGGGNKLRKKTFER